jgi:hypothetical protein
MIISLLSIESVLFFFKFIRSKKLFFTGQVTVRFVHVKYIEFSIRSSKLISTPLISYSVEVYEFKFTVIFLENKILFIYNFHSFATAIRPIVQPIFQKVNLRERERTNANDRKRIRIDRTELLPTCCGSNV